MNRRAFLGGAALLSQSLSQAQAPAVQTRPNALPNILWLVAEDIGPHIGAAGDTYSVTPNLDRLGQRGCVYNNCWSNAPVCAPARTTIISGTYPTALGAEHMRSMTRMPANWKMFPGYLRDAGYYCSNNAKEDYNIEKPDGTWDDSSNMAHWRNRRAGQPFFSVFNYGVCHESGLHVKDYTLVHDPAKVRVPAYHPDDAVVRRDWARYYDNITTMDSQVQERIDDLIADKLVDDTIIFFYGDHGSGMPRNKRFPYNSGLQVSLMAVFPEKYKHLAPKDYIVGKRSNRLVGFVDLAPSMLSLAGIAPKDHFQGQAFCGRQEASTRTYSYGFRGRMDERIDSMRTVRDQRYVYIKNFYPHKIYGQYIAYMWRTPTTAHWDQLYKEGKLKAPQTFFWETKPAEELYDLDTDRDEVKNLADSPQHKDILERLRKANQEHIAKVRDVGILPEAEIHARAGNRSPWEMGHDPNYPVAKILAAAELASSRKPGVTQQLIQNMGDADSGVRYWGVMGALIRGAEEVKATHAQLTKALTDTSAAVRVAAAEALGRYGSDADAAKALDLLVEHGDSVKHHSYIAIQALNAITEMGARAKPAKDRIAKLPETDPASPQRVQTEYTRNLLAQLRATL